LGSFVRASVTQLWKRVTSFTHSSLKAFGYTDYKRTSGTRGSRSAH